MSRNCATWENIYDDVFDVFALKKFSAAGKNRNSRKKKSTEVSKKYKQNKLGQGIERHRFPSVLHTFEIVYRQKPMDKTHTCIDRMGRISFGRRVGFLRIFDYFRSLGIKLAG